MEMHAALAARALQGSYVTIFALSGAEALMRDGAQDFIYKPTSLR